MLPTPHSSLLPPSSHLLRSLGLFSREALPYTPDTPPILWFCRHIRDRVQSHALIMSKSLPSRIARLWKDFSTASVPTSLVTRPHVSHLGLFSLARRHSSSKLPRTADQQAVPATSPKSSYYGRRFTPHEDSVLLERRKQGLAFKEIGAELKKDEMTVCARYRVLVLLFGMNGTVPRRKRRYRGRYSASDDATILRMKAEGFKFSEIAKKLSISGSYDARQMLGRWRGVVLRERLSPASSPVAKPRRTRLTDEEFARIQKMRGEGVKWNVIADSWEEQLSVPTLRNLYHARRYVTAQTSADGRSEAHRRWSAEDLATLIALRDQEGRSWTEISQRLNRSRVGVQQRWFRLKKETKTTQ